MPCYEPLRAVLISGPQGRRLSFKDDPRGRGISIPCGRCIGCRLERARQWAVRIMHESEMHVQSSFVTMTYDAEHLPKDGSLSVRDCQLFLKRLRFFLSPTKIRFFLCGEYGEKFARPHYHAIIFGYDFPDKKKMDSPSSSGFAHFTSKELTDLWGKGRCDVGAVSFDSACYVANYATKKVVGKGIKQPDGSYISPKEYYGNRTPEFLLMSRRPGIGRSWFATYAGDVFPADEVIVRGKEGRPPRYYSKIFSESNPDAYEVVRLSRENAASELEDMKLKSGDVVKVARSSNARRLAVRKTVAEAKARLKSRRLEDGNA